MVRVRTIAQAAREIKERDPESAIGENTLRKLVAQGAIPYIKRGNARLIAMEDIERYVNSRTASKENSTVSVL